MLATLIAVYGVLMTPLGWGWAGFVWGYAMAWFLVTDPMKLLAYRILDPINARPPQRARDQAAPTPDARAEAKPAVKAAAGPQAEPKPEAITEPKSETKAATKPEAEPRAGPSAAAKPDTKATAKPEFEPTPEAQATPKPQADIDVAALLDRSLGDLLVAGLIKDPADAGRIIAAAITQTEAPSVPPKAPNAQPDAKTQPASGPKEGP